MDTTLARPPIGQLLDGRYRVESHLARGGMATVYLGTDTRLDRTVALKIMHPEFSDDPDFVRRFVSEAKSIAKLSHPNVVTVFDQGADGSTLYLAMEYVPGRTLRDLLIERGRVTPAEALEIMEGILAGLGAAHEAGIAHRDVKPENVLLGERAIKVADFGLARLLAGATHTQSGVIIGTAAYLAPEQVAGARADVRTDVYAAGIILFELLTGTQPHVAETPLAVAYKHVNEVVPPPSELLPGLPSSLDALVTMATSRDPDLRPPDAGHFLGAVSAVLDEMPLSGSPAFPPHGGADLHGEETVPPGPGTWAASAAGWPGGPDTSDQYGPVAARYPNGSGGAGAVNHTLVVRTGDATATAPAVREPRLQRLLFSPRLGFLVAALVVIGALVGGGWWMLAGRFTTVPTIHGATVAVARAELKAAGLTADATTTTEASSTVPKGLVAGTSPAGGAHITKGSPVMLLVSGGPKMLRVPKVRGESEDDALASLRRAGLTSVRPVFAPAFGVKRGDVARTVPRAGSVVPVTQSVRLVVSNGKVLVPNVVGMSLGDAENLLHHRGFQVQVSGFHFFSFGRVIGFSPHGAQPPGTTITLRVHPFGGGGGNSGNSGANSGNGNSGNGNGNGNSGSGS